MADRPTRDPRAPVGQGDHGFVLQTQQLLPITEPNRLSVLATGPFGHGLRLAYSPPPRPVLRYPLPASDGTQRPVFILGAMRSGTTAIMHALSTCTNYVGPGEGHLLDVLAPMFLLIQRTYAERRPIWEAGLDTLITAVPEAFMMDAVRHAFVELAQTLFPNRHWFDKTPTPSMIVAAPILKAIWPEARFLFAKRRGIENILSRQRRFPHNTFADHCRAWADSMNHWELVRDHLGSSAAEIEHLAMARHPEKVANTIRHLLRLSDQEEVDIGRDLAEARPERTAETFASLHDIRQLPWTQEQIKMFWDICGTPMKRFGYADTEAYYAEAV